MVILTQDLAGFGNNMLMTANFLSNAAEHDYALAIPVLGRYAGVFESTSGKDECLFGKMTVRLRPDRPITKLFFRGLRLPMGGKVLRRLPWLQRLMGVRIVGDLNAGFIDLNSAGYLALAQNPRHLLVHEGWLYRDNRNFSKYAEQIRQFFRPIKAHRQAVARVLAANRAHADVLIGVHIRRGDYATWCNGAYFYGHATYARAMGELHALFPTEVRVQFLLFSNEPIPTADFAEFDTGYSTNHPVEDLYTMAGCDYILGAPSTYSTWASFYGRVPLCHLHHADQSITSLAEFVVFEDQHNWQAVMA